MLCISTVSARATGEIKSTWLGDVALIPGGGEKGREGEEEGEEGKKGKEGGKRRGEKKEERRQKLRSSRLQCLLFPGCNLACWPALLALSGVYLMQGRELARISTGLCKRNPSHSKPSLISVTQRLGDLQCLLHKKSGEVPGHQVKVLRHKSRRPEARAVTLM